MELIPKVKYKIWGGDVWFKVKSCEANIDDSDGI